VDRQRMSYWEKHLGEETLDRIRRGVVPLPPRTGREEATASDGGGGNDAPISLYRYDVAKLKETLAAGCTRVGDGRMSACMEWGARVVCTGRGSSGLLRRVRERGCEFRRGGGWEVPSLSAHVVCSGTVEAGRAARTAATPQRATRSSKRSHASSASAVAPAPKSNSPLCRAAPRASARAARHSLCGCVGALYTIHSTSGVV